jgi:ribonuclease P protein component
LALPKKYRLTKIRDFDRIFKEGRTVKGSFLFIKFILAKDSRFGLSVSTKAYKKASDRNRIKRVFLEKIKDYIEKEKKYDMIVVVNKKGSEDKLIAELAGLLDKFYD